MLRRHARWQDSGGSEKAGVAASLSGVGARIRSVTVYSSDHPGVPAGNRSLCDPVRRYAAQAPHCRLRSGRALAQIGSRRRHRHHSGHHRPVRTGTGTRPASVRCLRLVEKQKNLTVRRRSRNQHHLRRRHRARRIPGQATDRRCECRQSRRGRLPDQAKGQPNHRSLLRRRQRPPTRVALTMDRVASSPAFMARGALVPAVLVPAALQSCP